MKSPAFQIYPADFLADKNTLVMTAAEVGAYWLLLCVCWRENGLPDDVQELADLARTPAKQFQVSWERKIQRCFYKREDGKWTHNRLEKERVKQTENRKKKQEAGEKGAKVKWQTDSNAIAAPSPPTVSGNGNAIAKNSLSDCSLQIANKTHASAHAEGRTTDPLFESLATVCRIDWKVCTAEQRGALNQTCGILRKAGHTAADVVRVGEWWSASDWRGKQGQAPRPEQIREVWQQAFDPLPPSDEHPNAYRPGKMVL